MSHRWKVLLITASAVFMSFLDATIVNVAFPSIQRGFPHASFAGLSWILNAYNLVFAALLVPAGRIGDLLGRRRLFNLGLITFVAASLLCGLAQSVPFLVGARVLQAAGGAALVPSSLALLLPEFPPERRATATALWGATGAVAAACGPTLGALLVEWQSWRWVFYVNVPIGLTALAFSSRVLIEHRTPGKAALPDPVGVVLLIAAVAAISLGIIEGPAQNWGWGNTRVIASLGGGVLLLGAFIVRSLRQRDPAVDLSLFRVRSFAASNGGTLLFACAFYALILCNIEFLTGAWHYHILKAGLALTPTPVAAFVIAPFAGRLADRFGQRFVAIPGALLFALGCAVFATRTTAHADYVSAWLPAAIPAGIGIGIVFASFGSAAVAELPPPQFATGSAINSANRQLGAVLGVSVLVAVLAAPSAADAMDRFHQAWLLMAGAGVGSALCAVALGRVVVRDPTQQPDSATAPAAPPQPAGKIG
jgi:EmrB/QacA subfamily drug resistance transporter